MPTGTTVNIDTSQTEPDTAFTHGGDDTINATVDGLWDDQIHVYTNAGDDVVNISTNGWRELGIMHGAHIFTGSGSDQVYLNGLNTLPANQTVSGRLDDFDPASDSLWIDGEQLDLSAPHLLQNYDAEIILFKGQQYLRIVNDVGGQFLYALEGARLLNQPDIDRDKEEMHFLTWRLDRFDVQQENWTVTDYENPMNFVPEALYSPPPASAPRVIGKLNEEDINDPVEAPSETLTGSSAGDYIEGKRGNDIIRSYGGDDTIDAGDQFDAIWASDGNDIVNAGKGNDTVNGGSGNDMIAGGTDNDRLLGAAGDDTIWGGTEQDYLSGGSGDDVLFGGRGNDRLRGDSGNDSLSGDSGRDVLDGGTGNDTLIGGRDADVFIYSYGQGNDVITDFTNDQDSIRIHTNGMSSSPSLAGNAQQAGTDVVIDLGQGSSLTIRDTTLGELQDDLVFI